MLGFRGYQAERTVSAGAAVVVPVHGRGVYDGRTGGVMVMVMMVLVIVLNVLEETRRRCG